MAGTVLSLNHVGEHFQLQIGGLPLPLILPTQFATDGVTPIRDERGRILTLQPSHALIYTDKAIRWRADGIDPNPTMGFYVAAGSTINWLEPQTDFNGLLQRVKFVKDQATVGNATLEIAYFT